MFFFIDEWQAEGAVAALAEDLRDADRNVAPGVVCVTVAVVKARAFRRAAIVDGDAHLKKEKLEKRQVVFFPT